MMEVVMNARRAAVWAVVRRAKQRCAISNQTARISPARVEVSQGVTADARTRKWKTNPRRNRQDEPPRHEEHEGKDAKPASIECLLRGSLRDLRVFVVPAPAL